jgi:hypothetical protein
MNSRSTAAKVEVGALTPPGAVSVCPAFAIAPLEVVAPHAPFVLEGAA